MLQEHLWSPKQWLGTSARGKYFAQPIKKSFLIFYLFSLFFYLPTDHR